MMKILIKKRTKRTNNPPVQENSREILFKLPYDLWGQVDSEENLQRLYKTEEVQRLDTRTVEESIVLVGEEGDGVKLVLPEGSKDFDRYERLHDPSITRVRLVIEL